MVCVGHLTSAMAVHGDDFEKGEQAGTSRILSLTAAIARALGTC